MPRPPRAPRVPRGLAVLPQTGFGHALRDFTSSNYSVRAHRLQRTTQHIRQHEQAHTRSSISHPEPTNQEQPNDEISAQSSAPTDGPQRSACRNPFCNGTIPETSCVCNEWNEPWALTAREYEANNDQYLGYSSGRVDLLPAESSNNVNMYGDDLRLPSGYYPDTDAWYHPTFDSMVGQYSSPYVLSDVAPYGAAVDHSFLGIYDFNSADPWAEIYPTTVDEEVARS